ESTGDTELRLADLTYEFTYALTDDSERPSQAAWAPDGFRIAYVADNAVLRVRDIGGAIPEDVDAFSPKSPTFSPDGRKLAFVSSRSGSSDIWIHDFDFANDSFDATQLPSEAPFS